MCVTVTTLLTKVKLSRSNRLLKKVNQAGSYYVMAQTEFNTYPKCGIDKMKPTGWAAVSNDPTAGRETGFYREYKCDNCGYPDDGHTRVVGVKEQL